MGPRATQQLGRETQSLSQETWEPADASERNVREGQSSAAGPLGYQINIGGGVSHYVAPPTLELV